MATNSGIPSGAERASLPAKLPEPLQPQAVDRPPSGDQWLHEVKVDGYRMLARVDQADVRLVSRRQVDWTEKFSPVPDVLASLQRTAILDGEMTLLGPDGATQFAKLRSPRSNTDLLVYYVFDILYLDGWDLRGVPLAERKQILAEVLDGFEHPAPIQRVDHFAVNGQQFFEQVVQHQMEGVVSKNKASRYRSGQSSVWLKSKNKQQLPLVICGYEMAADSGYELVLGYHDATGELVYAGRVGMGFTTQHRDELRAALKPRKGSPFRKRSPKTSITWVEPNLVALVEQGAWKGAGFLREATYLGLLDMAAEDVSIADT